jgi:pseudouridine synthase
LERLNKFIARAGIVSRRNADLLIKAGKVTVNGLVIDQMGARINPAVDRVEVDGNPVKMKETDDYLILNKPPGFLSTVRDPFNRPTVMDLLPASYRELRIYPVGRLDKDTTGLLFFTNDGDLALALTHPRHLVEKTYLAKVNRIPATSRLSQLSKGILLDDGFTAPAKVGLESIENGNAIVKIILREGRKRQVKRMMSAIGHPVISLHRLTMGPLTLGDLKIGEYRKVNEFELQALLLLKENWGN